MSEIAADNRVNSFEGERTGSDNDGRAVRFLPNAIATNGCAK